MLRQTFILCMCVGLLGPTQAWQQRPTRMIHTRFSSGEPSFDSETGEWDIGYAFSNANTASLGGALQYPHAEIIATQYHAAPCQRRWNATWIFVYEFMVSNPEAAIDAYKGWQVPEYGRYAAFDSGQCTPPQPWCQEVFGGAAGDVSAWGGEAANSNGDLGPYVGAEIHVDDLRALYPYNYWFSFPGECAHEQFADKTEECSAAAPGGRCKGEYGTPEGTPDGVSCTWNYRVLGVADINGVAGMYDDGSVDPSDPVQAYYDWCMAGNVFYEFEQAPDGTFVQTEGLPFWENPSDPDANEERIQKLIEYYNNKEINPNNYPIPSVEELREANGPCYDNAPQCMSPDGTPICFRNDYQLCVYCADHPEAECETAPEGTEPVFGGNGMGMPGDTDEGGAPPVEEAWVNVDEGQPEGGEGNGWEEDNGENNGWDNGGNNGGNNGWEDNGGGNGGNNGWDNNGGNNGWDNNAGNNGWNTNGGSNGGNHGGGQPPRPPYKMPKGAPAGPLGV